MPACAAHYQFGQDVLSRLGEDLKPLIFAYKNEYNIGLQGPDIFFFYKPYQRTGIPAYGAERHTQPAVRMFAPILEKTRDKAALSYLLGLLCHFTLDKNCHPYVYGHSRGISAHERMESAYDRHVMTRHGLKKARYLYLPSAGLDYKAMASLWPGMTAEKVRKSVEGEQRCMRLFDHGLTLAAGRLAAKAHIVFSPMSIPDSVSGEQEEHARNLDAFYEEALCEGPKILQRAFARMGAKLEGEQTFYMNHKGERCG